MARTEAHGPDGALSAAQSPLEESWHRWAVGDLPKGAVDPELTELKQRRIVDGASKVLFEKGFHKTSIRDIAAACGMSMGQLYHYISSKYDILYLIHRHGQELWRRHLADAGFQDITEPVEKLEHGLRISIRYLSENRDLVQFICTESKYLDPEHLRRVLELDDQNVVGFYRRLLSEIPGGRFRGRECETAANLVAFACVFLALRGWNLHLAGDGDVEAVVDQLVDFIMRGLGIERGAKTEQA